MKNKLVLKVICVVIAMFMVIGLAGCGAAEKKAAADTSKETAKADETKKVEEKKAESVTIKFFSNLPDRKTFTGYTEQTVVDKYLKENPNVKVEWEILNHEPYKQKLKTYQASNTLPDIFITWGSPAELYPVAKAGQAAELNPDTYKDYNFFPGALNGFSYNGKLYGLPCEMVYESLYYNKKLFADNGLKAPESFDDLLNAAKVFRAKGIAPCAVAGKDKWPSILTFQVISHRVSEGGGDIYSSTSRKTPFAQNDTTVKTAKYYKQLLDAKFFQDGVTSDDTGAAKNMFAQEKAAMMLIGSWEQGMAGDSNLPESFRQNVSVVKFPAINGEKGSVDGIEGWFGTGYVVSSNSKVKDETIKLLNYIMKPDNFAKSMWQDAGNTPAQKYDTYFTGKETQLQKDITKILNEAKYVSGTPFNDVLTPGWKQDSENLIQQFTAGMLTPDKFLAEMDKAADKAKAEFDK